MCGIAAILSASGNAREPGGWHRARDLLARRGPDGTSTHRSSDGFCWLGHTRLAINDLSPAGDQPMHAPGVVAICNGEIYNAPDLRAQLQALGHRFSSTCDTEVIVHGYRAWGIDQLLDRVLGMFALVLWDDRERVLHGAVDHAAIKPLVFHTGRDRLTIASDCDALRAMLDDSPALDGVGLCHVLCLGYCPAPKTVWTGISKLGPGERLVWTPGAPVRVIRWWSPRQDTADPDEPFANLWQTVIDDHLQSDVPVGLLLSGGIDSACVAAGLAHAQTDRPVSCITLGLDSDDDETPAAAAVAEHLGLAHRRVAMGSAEAHDELTRAARAFDEPQAFGALLTMTAVARAAREHGTVFLSGDGGDEAFAGYTWHRAHPEGWNTPIDPAEHTALMRRVAQPSTDAPTRFAALDALGRLSPMHSYLQAVMPRFHPAEACAMLAPLEPDYDESVYGDWAMPLGDAALPWPRWAQRVDLGSFCAGSILPKVDRAAGAAGLEVRVPMLDRRVLAWAFAQRIRSAELRAQSSKPALRDYLKGRVPPEVLRRPKQGFSLRLREPRPWSQLLPMVDRSPLAEVLHPRWRRFVEPDVPFAEAKRFALCMLGAWTSARSGTAQLCLTDANRGAA